MNKNKKIGLMAIVVGVVVMIAGAYYMWGPPANDRMVVTNAVERVSNETLEFSFAYESGETGLSSIESPLGIEGTPLLQMYVLMESKAMIDYQKKEEGTETPPTISVLVFDPEFGTATETASSSTALDKIKDWAKVNNNITNINSAKTEISEIKIDGAPAIHYETDGLYAQDIYIARYSGRIYFFVGQYISNDDYMNTSFQEIINSVWFE